jgi:putative DNA primase/helicase
MNGHDRRTRPEDGAANLHDLGSDASADLQSAKTNDHNITDQPQQESPATPGNASASSVASDRTGQGQKLKLPTPEPWPEPVDGPSLIAGVANEIKRYVVLIEEEAEAIALWVLHTHSHDAFPISPRLAITSAEKGCGKTTLLDIVGRLVPRPMPTSNVTPASVFRIIEAARPTLLIDEADTFLTRNDDLRGILNSGHRRSAAHVTRTVGDDHEPRMFSTWAPVGIAMIGGLPDTLEDRSAPRVRLQRARPDQKVERFRADRCLALDTLARKAARWADDNFAALKDADPDVPECLSHRAADNWRPLLAIADAAGGEWPTRARHVAQKLGTAPASAMSEGVMCLADIREVFDRSKSDRILSAILANALNGMEDRPWGDCQRGKPLDPRGLARLLAPFGIHPRTVRCKMGNGKGYMREWFDDAFARYLPPAASETTAPSLAA